MLIYSSKNLKENKFDMVETKKERTEILKKYVAKLSLRPEEVNDVYCYHQVFTC